eukprot:6202149-Pleurochrysis_carterae.AAC.1
MAVIFYKLPTAAVSAPRLHALRIPSNVNYSLKLALGRVPDIVIEKSARRGSPFLFFGIYAHLGAFGMTSKGILS